MPNQILRLNLVNGFQKLPYCRSDCGSVGYIHFVLRARDNPLWLFSSNALRPVHSTAEVGGLPRFLAMAPIILWESSDARPASSRRAQNISIQKKSTLNFETLAKGNLLKACKTGRGIETNSHVVSKRKDFKAVAPPSKSVQLMSCDLLSFVIGRCFDRKIPDCQSPILEASSFDVNVCYGLENKAFGYTWTRPKVELPVSWHPLYILCTQG
jgi:hypothetical protein